MVRLRYIESHYLVPESGNAASGIVLKTDAVAKVSLLP